jgi:hypothetical protein
VLSSYCISGVDAIAIKIQLPVVGIFTISVFQILEASQQLRFVHFPFFEFRRAGAAQLHHKPLTIGRMRSLK